MTKNDITWHYTIGSDGSRICQSRVDHGWTTAQAYNGVHSGSSW